MSRFPLTPTGRIVRGSAGECLYEIPIPVLPWSVRSSFRNNPFPKMYVAADDGIDCPLHCEK
jgi:hypothetical protein